MEPEWMIYLRDTRPELYIEMMKKKDYTFNNGYNKGLEAAIKIARFVKYSTNWNTWLTLLGKKQQFLIATEHICGEIEKEINRKQTEEEINMDNCKIKKMRQTIKENEERCAECEKHIGETFAVPVGEEGKDYQYGNFLNAVDNLCHYFIIARKCDSEQLTNHLETYVGFLREN